MTSRRYFKTTIPPNLSSTNLSDLIKSIGIEGNVTMHALLFGYNLYIDCTHFDVRNDASDRIRIILIREKFEDVQKILLSFDSDFIPFEFNPPRDDGVTIYCSFFYMPDICSSVNQIFCTIKNGRIGRDVTPIPRCSGWLSC